MAEKSDGLTIKQKKFADFYLADGNATRAYKRAYGTKSDKAAGSNANRMLKNDKVQKYIKERQPEEQKKVNFTVEWLREEVLAVIKDKGAKPRDKLKGYEILGKTMGAFEEKKSVSFDEDVVIEVVRNDKTEA